MKTKFSDVSTEQVQSHFEFKMLLRQSAKHLFQTKPVSVTDNSVGSQTAAAGNVDAAIEAHVARSAQWSKGWKKVKMTFSHIMADLGMGKRMVKVFLTNSIKIIGF